MAAMDDVSLFFMCAKYSMKRTFTWDTPKTMIIQTVNYANGVGVKVIDDRHWAIASMCGLRDVWVMKVEAVMLWNQWAISLFPCVCHIFPLG